ncbi:TetR family transcriptional regulator [Novosphingobium sp. PhB165]|uniref:TetR family transcriptional regulator n=1 Tax=Novosphingobium sp. PhB165 TaxID=2485105 RepID=UPI0010DA371A|nr:TetR family transcriptional regulator [Novosphingobium sp. PhB165]TCM20489.1 TetR family transcriptional regulator [Novosphingobium sp. PhB165]
MDKPVVPKRRNLAATQERIVAVAAATFARLGYAQASLRDIAERADVAPSLISKYFGTKARLFEHALMHVVRANTVFSQEKAGFGEAMARLIPDRSNADITVMLVLALAHPESREVAMRVSRREMIEPLMEWLGPPHAAERAMDMFALLSGFAIQMQGLHEGPIPEHSLRWLAQSLQAIVDVGRDR